MERRRKRRIYPGMAIIGIVLTLLTTACQTSPSVEYIHEIPDVIFPVFPPPDSVTLDDETELVSMPLWYWQKIAEYKIDIDAIEAHIEALRKIKDAENEAGDKKQ